MSITKTRWTALVLTQTTGETEMADAIHCDRDGCDTWTRNPEDHGFLAVNWWGDWGSKKDFCSWDCVLAYGMTKPPLEVIENA